MRFGGLFVSLIAWRRRRRPGQGQYIDLCQNEAISCLIGDTIMDYTLSKRVEGHRGKRHSSVAPRQGFLDKQKGRCYKGVAESPEWPISEG